jgi:Ulp1 family protease
MKKDEATAKNKTFDILEWQLINMVDIPQQNNGFDCGVFVIVCADYGSYLSILKTYLKNRDILLTS